MQEKYGTASSNSILFIHVYGQILIRSLSRFYERSFLSNNKRHRSIQTGTSFHFMQHLKYRFLLCESQNFCFSFRFTTLFLSVQMQHSLRALNIDMGAMMFHDFYRQGTFKLFFKFVLSGQVLCRAFLR